MFNSAVGRISFCHLSFPSLSSLSKGRFKSNFWLAGSGTAVSCFPCSRQLVLDRSDRVFIIWSKRIRTFACRYQKPMPYHLAILHRPVLDGRNGGMTTCNKAQANTSRPEEARLRLPDPVHNLPRDGEPLSNESTWLSAPCLAFLHLSFLLAYL